MRALPGAAELLQTVATSGIFGSSVVSGNLEPMARVKLEAAGLYSYLCRGAYGSDSPRRADLPAIAKRRCEAVFGVSIPLSECIVIGDTPRDLEAARCNRMKCILVGNRQVFARRIVKLPIGTMFAGFDGHGRGFRDAFEYLAGWL